MGLSPRELAKFAYSWQILVLVGACNSIFVFTYWLGVHKWGLGFWECQLAWFCTSYVGLLLFWRWNGFVPTQWQWIGVLL